MNLFEDETGESSGIVWVPLMNRLRTYIQDLPQPQRDNITGYEINRELYVWRMRKVINTDSYTQNEVLVLENLDVQYAPASDGQSYMIRILSREGIEVSADGVYIETIPCAYGIEDKANPDRNRKEFCFRLLGTFNIKNNTSVSLNEFGFSPFRKTDSDRAAPTPGVTIDWGNANDYLDMERPMFPMREIGRTTPITYDRGTTIGNVTWSSSGVSGTLTTIPLEGFTSGNLSNDIDTIRTQLSVFHGDVAANHAIDRAVDEAIDAGRNQPRETGDRPGLDT